MPFIDFVGPDSTDPAVRDYYAAVTGEDGNISNMFPPHAHEPSIFHAWNGLLGAIREQLDLRRYELATLAAAKELRSSYCMLAHGSVLLEKFYSEEALQAILADHHRAGLAAADVALMDFATKVARDATAITQADIDAMKTSGHSDREIYLFSAAAAARSFITKLVDALGVQPDGKYLAMPESLRKQLVVGRPIDKPA
ncbi:MAG: carboxymuconolactone decarboxylase family protein [Gammaproteobacteria bacterium]|nr:carboxymuconolactone decarboxylase family protein [Gammaproteobacteria bacterium]